jgi:DNA (cytosine-5)-methyltransferase 1
VLRKHWPDVPIHPDVRELKGDAVGPVDIITGGYPCQPFSYAGERRGEGDDRHLWPHFARLIRELRPRWVLGENVAGHITLGLDDVLTDLEGLGYSWEAFVIPAVAVDARHRRERLWVVAEANEERERGLSIGASAQHSSAGFGCEDVAHPAELAEREPTDEALAVAARGRARLEPRGGSRWLPEPGVGRVADGIPDRMDRLSALGNAIVPQVAEEIFRAICAVN